MIDELEAPHMDEFSKDPSVIEEYRNPKKTVITPEKHTKKFLELYKNAPKVHIRSYKEDMEFTYKECIPTEEEDQIVDTIKNQNRTDPVWCMGNYNSEGKDYSKKEDIDTLNMVIIDLDGEDHSGVKSNEELRELHPKVNKLYSRDWINPLVSCSGNGYHVFIPVPETSVDEIEDLTKKLKKLAEILNTELHGTIDLSVTRDIAKVIGIPGSVNNPSKYEKPLQRFFLDRNLDTPIEGLREKNKGVIEFIKDLEVNEEETHSSEERIIETKESWKKNLKNHIEEIWEPGRRNFITLALAGFGARKNLPKEDITTILKEVWDNQEYTNDPWNLRKQVINQTYRRSKEDKKSVAYRSLLTGRKIEGKKVFGEEKGNEIVNKWIDIVKEDEWNKEKGRFIHQFKYKDQVFNLKAGYNKENGESGGVWIHKITPGSETYESEGLLGSTKGSEVKVKNWIKEEISEEVKIETHKDFERKVWKEIKEKIYVEGIKEDSKEVQGDRTEDIHLMDIEKSKYEKKKVRTEVTVRGVGGTYKVPKQIRIYDNEDPNYEEYIWVNKNNTSLIRAIDKNEDFVRSNICKRIIKKKLGLDLSARSKRKARQGDETGEEAYKEFEVTKKQSITELIVSPVVRTIKESNEGTLVDGEGRAYRKKKVYYEGTLETTDHKFLASGYSVTNPDNGEATILITDLKTIDTGIDQFEVTDKFKEETEILQVNKNQTIEEKVNWIVDDLRSITKLIGRDNGLLLDLLAYHSALKIEYEGEKERGWLETVKHGDTTTGKSQGTRRLLDYINLGSMITGETSSRTGFLYTIDTNGKKHTVVWGQYPMNDKKLLAVDGANYISKGEWGESREARRTGVLNVNRSASDTTRCRTRLTIISNAEKNGEIISLNSSAYPITTLKYIYDEPDIARFDAVVMYADEDVTKDQIFQNRNWKEPEINGETLRRNILWVWSREEENIVLNEEAEDKINEVARKLSEKFGVDSVPLISNDTDKKIARMSVALAGVLHSTDKTHEKIIVKPNHVKYIKKYLETIYTDESSSLDSYAERRKKATRLSEEEYYKILKDLVEREKRAKKEYMGEILNLLFEHDVIRKSEIKARLEASKNTIKKKINTLKKHHLVKSTRYGYRKRPKFVRFLKRLKEVNGRKVISEEEVKKIEESMDEEKVTKITSKIQSGLDNSSIDKKDLEGF